MNRSCTIAVHGNSVVIICPTWVVDSTGSEEHVKQVCARHHRRRRESINERHASMPQTLTQRGHRGVSLPVCRCRPSHLEKLRCAFDPAHTVESRAPKSIVTVRYRHMTRKRNKVRTDADTIKVYGSALARIFPIVVHACFKLESITRRVCTVHDCSPPCRNRPLAV